MIKLIDLLKESNKILVPRRFPEERQKNFLIATQKKIKKYMVDGGKGDLDLSDTPITSLPNGLKVEGDLNLDNTKITSLPNDLQVGRDLDLFNTPISEKYTKEQIKQMCPGIKGNIYTPIVITNT